MFLSARCLDSDIHYGKALAADDYLTKPVKPEDLLAVVRGKLQHYQRLLGLIQPPTAPTLVTLSIGSHHLCFDCRQRRVWIDETRVNKRQWVRQL